MECPYCGKEMEDGLIQSANEIAWYKGRKRHVFRRAAFHKDSVVLSRLSLFKGSAVTAYLCRDCKKVIINASPVSDYNAPV